MSLDLAETEEDRRCIEQEMEAQKKAQELLAYIDGEEAEE